jgi:ankyrin repeat protein
MHRAASSLHRKDRPADIESLIHAGADVDHKNHESETPLHKAYSGEVVEALVQAGADVHSRDDSTWTPLHRAWSAEVAGALIRAGADVSSRDCRNLTLLHLVWQDSKQGYGIELTRTLIDAGADPNACADVGPDFLARADDPAWTPLAWIQAAAPRIGCRIPFGPSRSQRAALARCKAKHAEIVGFLERLDDADLLKIS